MAKNKEELLKYISDTFENPSYTPVSERKSITTLPTIEPYVSPAKRTYQTALKNLNEQKNTLTSQMKNRGIVTSNYTSDKLPTYQTVYNNALNDINFNKKYETLKNITPSKSSDIVNSKIASEYQKSDEYKNQFENAQKAKDILGYAQYNYDKEQVDNSDVSFFDKTLGTLARGSVNFTEKGPKVRDGKGGYIELPTYNDLKTQQVQESYDDSFFGHVGKIMNGATYEVGRMVPSFVLNTVIPGVNLGDLPYYGSMFVDTLQEAKNDGYDDKQSLIYSTLSTALEYATGKALSGVTNVISGGEASELNKAIAKGLGHVMNNKGVINFLSHAGSEGAEEFIQEFLDKALRKLTLGENNNVFDGDTFSDAIYSAAVGAVTGGIASIGDNSLDIKTKKDYDAEIKEKEDIIKIPTKNDINEDISISDKIDKITNGINVDNNVNTDINNNISNINENLIQESENAITNLSEKRNNIKNSQEQAKISEDINALKKQVSEINNNIYDTNNNTSSILTENEQREYKTLTNLPFKLDNNQISRLEYLQNKMNNRIKYPELENKTSYDSIKEEYKNYKDLSNFDNTLLNTAKSFVESYNNTGKRTKEQWLSVAKMIGTNFNGDSVQLEKYAIQSWFYEKPNIKENLNRQGSKYVNFQISDWLSAVYNGAGVGKVLNSSNVSDMNEISKVYNNNANNVLIPTANDITLTKGNIPINENLLNKYSNVKDIFDNESSNFDGKVEVKSNIPELDNVDISSLNSKDAKALAYEIFNKYNSKSTLTNNGNKITVSKSGINESVEKIFASANQRKLLAEHFKVFSDLGDIIENATLVNQTRETKNRKYINSWNYYFDGLVIDNVKYDLEFDVRSLDSGENQYRVQRLQEKTKKQITHSGDASNKTRILPAFEQSAFYGNNIPQSNENVKLPSINNMTENAKNIPIKNNLIENSESSNNHVLDPIEISKLTKEDANTTPKIPTSKTINKKNDGDSHFAQNIKDKVNMLDNNAKAEILSKADVRYYDKVTNKESLDKAFKRLNDGGSSETLRWIKQDSKKATSVDVAEGYILLKQYSDNGDYDSMVEVAKKMREIGTTAGQTVQAFNIMERMTPEGMVKYAQSELTDAYNQMVKNKSKDWIEKHREDFDLKPTEVQFIMDNMKEVSNMQDGYEKRVKLAEIQKIMTDKLPAKKGAKIKSWMRISMLFNPKTQVRNVVGNALIIPVNHFSDLFSSYADKIVAKTTGVRTTGTTNVKAMLDGMKRGAYEATNDYKKGINTKDMEGNRFEISDGKSFDDKKVIGRALNQTESLLNYIMDVGDRVFSEAAFENSIRNQMVLNNTNEITQDMIDIAHTEALQRTWNDNNSYTKFVLDNRRWLNNMGLEAYGLGDVLIPFAKTPANLTKAIVDYSPAGVVNAFNKYQNMKNAIETGQFNSKMQHEFVQTLGKATAGTMLYIAGIALAKAKITSGKSDDDKDTANFLKNTLGISSYSIKIGNKSFTYDWAQPLAAPLSITANIVSSRKNKEQALAEGILSSLNTAGSILLEQSFLQSINDVLNDNSDVVSGLINEILQLPSRAVPTFSKQIVDLTDKTQRTSYEYGKPLETALNSVKAKIPGLSKTLAPSVDTMGREVERYGGKNNLFNVFLNPANVNTENISNSAKEIYRLYQKTGDNSIMPRVAPYYINKSGEKIVLDSKTKSEYQKVSGKIIEDNVQKLLKNDSYLKLNDTEKASVVKSIVDYSYNKAKESFLDISMSNTYNAVNKYVSNGGKVSDYYLNKNTTGTIYSDKSLDSSEKKEKIPQAIINSNLTDKELAYLYSEYYSSEDKLNDLITMNIPIKEYLKLNGQTFESDYNSNGKAVSGSKQSKVINYVNSLNLSVAQKAILIKKQYNSYDDYDNKIIDYVNKLDINSNEKKVLLKSIGFTNYNEDIVKYINSQNLSATEKEKKLKDLGFTIRNGRVYW